MRDAAAGDTVFGGLGDQAIAQGSEGKAFGVRFVGNLDSIE
jgi:hypothetical protein